VVLQYRICRIAGFMLAGTETPDGKAYGLVRDKDMPSWLASPGSLGFMGSDTYTELDDRARSGITFTEVAQTGLRFALAARSEVVDSVRAKLQAQETVNIVTSNPRAAKQSVGALGGSALRIVQVVGGSVEVAPQLLEGVDAVFDLVDSGRTLRENGLEIVTDDLMPISIGAVWRNNGELAPGELPLDADGLQRAIAVIEARVVAAQSGERGSYTQSLAANPSRLVKKMSEEAGELLEAFLVGSEAEVCGEAADVLYTLAIACSVRETSLLQALAELANRNK
jgi:phosphoribosyl-ATP pyrophosphohydrolase